jgi:hypothetical protein
MRRNAEHRCDQHPDPYDCPDNLVLYNADDHRYGLIIHEGCGSSIQITFCPWCGTRLPTHSA